MNIRSAAIVVSGIVVAIIIVNGYLSVMKNFECTVGRP
jgi:hypothetical protein